jgi:hypothetical protein
LFDIGSLNCDPGFTSSDTTDINSFMLSEKSPLIGVGIKVDDELTEDFFGNVFESCNIGCYGGAGTDAEYTHEESQSTGNRYILTIPEFLTMK